MDLKFKSMKRGLNNIILSAGLLASGCDLATDDTTDFRDTKNGAGQGVGGGHDKKTDKWCEDHSENNKGDIRCEPPPENEGTGGLDEFGESSGESGYDESTSGSAEELQPELPASACYEGIDLGSTNARISVNPAGWGVGEGDFTLEFHVKLHNAFDGSGGGAKILTMNEQYAAHNVQSWLTPEGQVVCNTYHDRCPCGPQSGTGIALVRSKPITDGNWHHVACVRTGDRLTVYTDGEAGESDYVKVSLTASSNVAIGKQGGYASSTAAPVSLGSIRFSKVARYVQTFKPEAFWDVDANTVSQFLTSQPFDGETLPDEAGGDNKGWHDQDVYSFCE